MSDRQNPVRMIEDNKDNHKDVLRLFGDVNLDLEIVKELIEVSLQKANVCKLNDEELAMLCPMFGLEESDDEVCRVLIKYNLHYLILTAGCKSSTIYSQHETSTIPTPEVTVADTGLMIMGLIGGTIFPLLMGKAHLI
ncbi:MAG: hypothetical protein LBV74_14670 [Tannerella sp.]|jgi:fructokinase|nr:hypothetical protein [Tannerella sp.]